MTQPACFTENWYNPPAVPATVNPPGGTTTPGAGTVETWTMAGGFAAFTTPGADPTVIPPRLFRLYDPDRPAEAFRVSRTAGATWDVVRGDMGSPVIAHAPGFEVRSLISAEGLRALAAGVPSNNGLVIPAAGRGAARVEWTDANEHLVASLAVPGGEAVPGSVYEATAWGWYHTGGLTNQNFTCGLRWGTATVGFHQFSLRWSVAANPAPQSPARWKLHGLIDIHGNAVGPAVSAYANTTAWFAQVNDPSGLNLADGRIEPYMFGPAGATAVNTAAAQVFSLYVQMQGNTGNRRITWQGAKTWRAA